MGAITAPNLAGPVCELDQLAHTTWTVPMWTRYRTKHAQQCRVRHQEVAL